MSLQKCRDPRSTWPLSEPLPAAPGWSPEIARGSSTRPLGEDRSPLISSELNHVRPACWFGSIGKWRLILVGTIKIEAQTTTWVSLEASVIQFCGLYDFQNWTFADRRISNTVENLVWREIAILRYLLPTSAPTNAGVFSQPRVREERPPESPAKAGPKQCGPRECFY